MDRFTVQLEDKDGEKLTKAADDQRRPRAQLARCYILDGLESASSIHARDDKSTCVHPELTDEEMGERLFGYEWPRIVSIMSEHGLDVKGAIAKFTADFDGLDARVDILNESGG